MIITKRYISKLFASILIVFSCISCEEILFETDISQEEIILLAPQDGAELNFTSINFNWSPVLDANKYNFQLATPSFENANQIIEDIVLDSITEFSTSLMTNQYQWRVKAMNSAYETNYSSARFEVLDNEDFQNNIVTILEPSNNLISNLQEVSFEWSAVQDATGYRVQIQNNTDGSILDDLLITETSYSFTFEDGSFTFQVRAEKDDQVTAYANRILLIDTIVPNTPTLTSPENMSVVSDAIISFTWDREDSGGADEFDTISIYSDQELTTLVQEEIATAPFETTLDNGNYYWIVQTKDEAGNESDLSSVFSFTKN